MADLEDLLSRLIDHDVDFVIVGGFAAVAHGASLLTQDIDVCCDFSEENLMRLQDALQDLHPVHRMTPNKLPLELTQMSIRGVKNLYLDSDGGQLDCLGEIKGIGDFEHVKARSVAVQLGDGTCRILDLQALIEAKSAMDRPRDREAVVQLKAIQEKQSDGACR